MTTHHSSAQNSHFFTSQSKKQVQGVCYFYAELSPACCMPPCSCGVLHTTSLVRGPTPTECLVPRPAAAPHQVLPWHQPQPGDSPECGGNLQSRDMGHVLSLDPIKCVNFISLHRLQLMSIARTSRSALGPTQAMSSLDIDPGQ